MSFFNLLSFFDKEFTESDTQVVTIVAWCLLGVLLVLAIVLLAGKKRMKTVDVVYGGVALALSFVLSYIKISPVQYGGSVTLASMLPVILYAYYFGFGKGIIVGLAHGLLQFVQDPYILTPVTFVLDYLLAFAAIAFAALPKKAIKNDGAALFAGASLTYVVRFLSHFVSGIIYFNMGAIWADIPAPNAVAYSLLYQVVYLVPDWIICVAILLTLWKLGVIEKIAPSKFRTEQK